MINPTGYQPPPQSDPSEPPVAKFARLNVERKSGSDSPGSAFAGKSVSLARSGSQPINPASIISTTIAARSVQSVVAPDPLPVTLPGDFVNWGEVDQQIIENLTFQNVYLFAAYLGIPNRKLDKFQDEFLTHGDPLTPSQLLAYGLTLKNLKVTHEQLLMVLADSHRSDLIELHCEKSGIAIDRSRLLSDWPACVQAADTDAALNHELDFFKLNKSLEKEGSWFLCNIPTTTLAYAAGYPELLDDPYFEPSAEIGTPEAIIHLLKRILDKNGGSITTNEFTRIMSNPEIMAINCAYLLIESLKGNTVTYLSRKNTDWQIHREYLALNLPTLGVNAEHFGRALGLPLHVVQKIVFRAAVKGDTPINFGGLLSQAINCVPGLKPGQIIHAIETAGRASGCADKVKDWIEQEKKEARLPWFNEFPPEALPEPTPLYGQEDDNSTSIASSQPLTLDFLRHLPLSHNWYLIGLAMGLVDELESIGSMILQSSQPVPDRLSLAAPALSKLLVQKGLETGHLYLALKILDDQAALAYFPRHLAGPPEKKLPKRIAEAIAQGRLMARIVPVVGSQNLKMLRAMISNQK